MNENDNEFHDDLEPEYDFSSATQGKHYSKYQQGSNVVLLESDVAAIFHDSASVNEALRLLVKIAKEQINIPKSA